MTKENLHYELSLAQSLLSQFLKTAERLELMFEINEVLNIDFFRQYRVIDPPDYDDIMRHKGAVSVMKIKSELSAYLEGLPVLKKGPQTSLVFLTISRLFDFLHDERNPVTRSSVHRKEPRSMYIQGNNQGSGTLNDIEFFHLAFSLAFRVSGVEVKKGEIQTALKEVIRQHHKFEDFQIQFEEAMARREDPLA